MRIESPIVREETADRINAVLNDPAVRPWVANDADGILDMGRVVADRRNVCLMGDHGGCMFLWIQPGVYEAHTQVLPAGRGEWTRGLTEASVRFMFTRTDAYEIVTRVPAGHPAAKAAAEAQGMRLEFTREQGVVFRNRLTDVRLYSFRVQDWVPRAPGIEDTGRWLHRRMGEEAVRLGIEEPTHAEDENHNRYVGAAVEMAFGGQVAKAIGFYNRWVSMVRHVRAGRLQHVSLVSVDPLVIRFDIGLMRFLADDIEVIRTC